MRGGGSPKELVHNLLMQFFTLGNLKIKVSETYFFYILATQNDHPSYACYLCVFHLIWASVLIGTYRLVIGTCCLAIGTYPLAIGTYRLAIDTYSLAIRTCRLAKGRFSASYRRQ